MINLNKKDSVADSVKSIMEKELSPKQKQIAKMSPPADKIDAGDLAKLRSGQKPVKEAAKPDFLDLDKDGNKKEPMKQAAKQAKMKEEIDPKRTTTDTLKGREKSSKNPLLSKKVFMDVPGDVNEDKEQIEEKEKWIQKAIKKPGALHKQLHVPAGEKIPAEKLKAAAEKGGKIGKRANLAMTLKKFKEEYEEHSIYDQMIQEVLSKDAKAGDWIHDFIHSDNPKFAGKSKEKRKQMALAAYYAKQRNEEVESDICPDCMQDPCVCGGNHVEESVEQIDEGLGHFVVKQMARLTNKNDLQDHHMNVAHDMIDKKLGNGHPQANNILSKHKKLAKDAEYHKKSDEGARQHFADNMQTLHNDIKSARSVKEDIEQIDEKVMETLFQTVHGKHSVNSQTHTHPDDKHYNTNTLIHKGNIKPEGGARKKFEVHSHINRGLTFMTHHSDEEKKAIKDHLVKNKYAHKSTPITEDVEQIDESLGHWAVKQMARLTNKNDLQDHHMNVAHDMVDKKLGNGHPQANNILSKHKKMARDAQYHKKSDDEARQHFADNLQTLHNDIKSARSVKEEVEQIDELSKSTLGSYVKSAARDVGASRKLSADFQNQADKARKPSAKAAASRISDKFKVTALKRHVGIGKAVERLTKEESEQVEENAFDWKKPKPPESKGGSGVKAGRAYGGAAQKSKPEHDEPEDKKKVTESKRPETDNVPFEGPYNPTSRPATVTDKSGAKHTPMSRVKHLAKQAMKRMKTEMLGKTGTSE